MKTTTTKATEKFAPQTDKRVELLERALDLQSQIKNLSAELTEIKEFFYKEFEKSKTEERFVCSAGAAILKTTNSYSVLPELIPQLKRIFKEQYSEFVTQKISYNPSAALKKLLADADYKHAQTIREAVEIKTSNSITFEQAKG